MVSRTRSIERAASIAIHGAEARGEEPSITTMRKWLKVVADMSDVGNITYRVESDYGFIRRDLTEKLGYPSPAVDWTEQTPNISAQQ